ncbi:TRAP transporter permease [Chloroflexota bacterium]
MRNKLDIIISTVAIGMAMYHMANVYIYMVGGIEHRFIHITFALVLLFLTIMKTSKRRWPLILLILVSVGTIGYLWANLERLLSEVGFPMPFDVVVGFIIIGIVLWACRLALGIVLPIVAIILLLYGLFGHYVGGALLRVDEVITAVCLIFLEYDMFGKLLTISANIIFLFIFYSGLLQGLRATDFFTELGKLMGRYTRSGPAMTAVVSSAFMGMTAGQATPNIAVTGAFTIPLMKKVGYKPEVAGSIEAAASGGGQIMPPIMGAGAFVMADLLGVPYTRIIMLAAIPAILYFFSVGVFVHLHALKANVIPLKQEVDKRRLYATAPLFLVPLIVILVLLFMHYPPMFAAFWGIVLLLVLTSIRRETRPSLGAIVTGCVQGARTGAMVAVAAATLGPIIALMTKTGVGLKIGYSVDLWSGGNLFLGLLILMAAVIILGLEVPTVAAYLMAAIVAIPALVRLGLDPVQGHMFAFYFASFSGLTPPVGMAAIVASKMAGAPYIKTALHSVNAAAAAYLIPFVFVFNGALLLLPGTNPLSLLISILVVLLGLAIFQIGFVGHFLTSLNQWERPLAIISGLGLLVFAAIGAYQSLLISAVLLIPVILWQFRKSRLVKDL